MLCSDDAESAAQSRHAPPTSDDETIDDELLTALHAASKGDCRVRQALALEILHTLCRHSAVQQHAEQLLSIVSAFYYSFSLIPCKFAKGI